MLDANSSLTCNFLFDMFLVCIVLDGPFNFLYITVLDNETNLNMDG